MKQKIFSAAADTLKDSELRPLYDLWDSRRGERFLPDRKDFQFRDFQPWFGRIAVGSIPASGQHICFDLVGTEITKWDGLDMTGQIFSFSPGSPTLQLIVAPYLHAYKTQKPTVSVSFKSNTQGELTRLVLPCSHDGVSVNKQIVAFSLNPAFKALFKKGSLLDLMTPG
ncbi:hypothetical protein GCM10007972_01040 [Iodidimonas muriae]|uniref:PAS domain-containing protein n=1 Tax=Iodidimonas muriae TaxID=261467 RepID=A0ABQ2L5Z5_9PROT|nr:PAS domain-containing protein [Iodidimonas muriae]GGO04555.1 hypothetical protein GCM10007972_01040 [Iodidimonas muriae]